MPVIERDLTGQKQARLSLTSQLSEIQRNLYHDLET